jgi:hypothetical protein
VFGKYRLSHRDGAAVGVLCEVMLLLSGIVSSSDILVGKLQAESSRVGKMIAVTIYKYFLFMIFSNR